MMSPLRTTALIALAACFAITNVSAGIFSFDIAFENDGDLLTGPFGTIVVSESAANTLTFTIDVDNSELGAGADLQHFGFQLQNYSGSLILSPGSIAGQTIELFTGPSNNTKVAGMGNTQFDYLVHLGNGSPQLDPVTFTLTGSTSLDLGNLGLADTIVTNTGITTNFGIHVQSTSTAPGSEALGGRWIPTVVPEPNLFGLLAASCSAVFATRRRRTCRTRE